VRVAAHPTYARFFDVLDRDGNGELEASDFTNIGVALASALGARTRPGALEAAEAARNDLWELLLLCLDADGSGTVSREEFLVFEQMLAQQTAEFGDEPPWLRAFFRTLFEALDTEGAGVIDGATYAGLARALGVTADVSSDFARLTGGGTSFALGELDVRLTELFRSTDPDARGLALLPGRARSAP
jgi:hypothetical protein